MPYKHQAHSYRMIEGARYEAWQDVPAAAARSLAMAIRQTGVACRTVKLSGEPMARVFVPAGAVNLPWWDCGTDSIRSPTEEAR